MKLLLKRKNFTEKSTIGFLYVDGEFFCYTLEDAVREVKVPGKTAIPTGTYRIIIDYSDRFKRDMPHILNVPNFLGVRIHSGNTDADTNGCVLVGRKYGKDAISESKLAYEALLLKLQAAFVKGEEITIEVVNER